MTRSWPVFSLLATLAFSGATTLQLQSLRQPTDRAQSADVLKMMLGDSRRLFADHFFEKADIYFHSGYYPSIFDRPDDKTAEHLQEKSDHGDHDHGDHDHGDHDHGDHDHGDHDHGDHDHGDHDHGSGPGREVAGGDPEHDKAFVGLEKRLTWIDRFGAHFLPNQHTHLRGAGAEREILPWLRLSAELDPHRIETYTVASFWLRTRLNRPDAALQFLRQGLRENPGHYALLLEMGRIYAEHRDDADRGRNLLELALVNWRDTEARKEEPDLFNLRNILVQLIRIEEAAGNSDRVIDYFEKLKLVSPGKEAIEERLRELKAERDGVETGVTPAVPRSEPR